MKYQDITKKTDKQLQELLSEKRIEVRELRRGLRTRETTAPHEIAQSRKTVARILTELKQRELKEQ